MRDADRRESVRVEREALRQSALADEQHGAGILVALGHLGEHFQRMRVRHAVGQIRHERQKEMACADRVQHFGCPQYIEIGERRVPYCIELGQPAQRDIGKPQSAAGNLAVIGGRIARRGFVMCACLRQPVCGLRRPALPIFRAREGDRVGDPLRDPGEMRHRQLRIVQESQRDPAGGELVLAAIILARWRRRVAGDPVRSVEISGIHQLSANQAALAIRKARPPFVRFDRFRLHGGNFSRGGGSNRDLPPKIV